MIELDGVMCMDLFFSLDEVILDDFMIPQLKLIYPETTYLFTNFYETTV